MPFSEARDAFRAVEGLVLDLDAPGAGHHAADVKEAQAALVVLVELVGFVDHSGIEQNDSLPFGPTHQGSELVDADLVPARPVLPRTRGLCARAR